MLVNKSSTIERYDNYNVILLDIQVLEGQNIQFYLMTSIYVHNIIKLLDIYILQISLVLPVLVI